MHICQNGPLDKLMQFLFMSSSALCTVTIKIYAVQIYATFVIYINLTQKFVALQYVMCKSINDWSAL